MTRLGTCTLLLLTASACDPCSGLVARIEALHAGETLRVPDGCVVSESVTIPAGARVEAGTFEMEAGESITLVSSPDASQPTTLDGATVRGGNDLAPCVVARGEGHVALSASRLELERGIGVGISGAHATIDDVELIGSFDPATALEVPSPVDPSALATFGIVAIDGADVTSTDLSVRRMAVAALACVRSTWTMHGATLEENLGVGVSADHCDATLDDLEIAGTVAAPLRPGMGVVALASTIAGANVHLHDAPGYGVLAGDTDIELAMPRVERLEQAGIWIEDASSLVVDGGAFDANRGAAIAAVGAERLEVHDTVIRATGLAPIPTGEGTGLERMGDAIHVARAGGVPSEVDLADVTLSDNARVGLVLDGAMSALSITIARTRVETTGTELGALAQNVAGLPTGWDAGITRVGSATTLDATAPALVVSGGGLTGILMPPTITF